MLCPLCGKRKAKRACPALGRSICALCCGTKRLTEIRCPDDCVYLASSREHAAASVLRDEQVDVLRVLESVRDLNSAQTQLFLHVMGALVRYRPDDLSSIVDADVADATASLAATFETASRGVIYDHRPASLPAARLAGALKAAIDAQGARGTAFERDAAVVLRRIEASARAFHSTGKPTAYLDIVAKLASPEHGDPASDADARGGEPPPRSRLIVP